MKTPLSRALLVITIFTFLCSCNTNKRLGFSKEEYITAYKKAVIYGCLDKASNGNFVKFSEENNDLGTTLETVILYNTQSVEAQNLGANLSKNIKIIDYADYEGRAPIFSDCLDLAFSKSVKSIAKEKYRQRKKSKLEYVYE
jgi:hypothetical protein|tara:strand:+ start:1860 stop:2285 length:426 start_codon:yes stop_codon:yes gene_type:complete